GIKSEAHGPGHLLLPLRGNSPCVPGFYESSGSTAAFCLNARLRRGNFFDKLRPEADASGLFFSPLQLRKLTIVIVSRSSPGLKVMYSALSRMKLTAFSSVPAVSVSMGSTPPS